jgi:hypothetical protein
VAFVAGMIPTFISNAEGSETNKAISGVVIGGQTFSLLLTLLATPVAYSLFDDLGNLLRRLFGRTPRAKPEELNQSPDGLPAVPAAVQPLRTFPIGEEKLIIHPGPV